MARSVHPVCPDPHSYADSTQPDVKHLDWHALVDFDARRLLCSARLTLSAPAEGALDLDSRDLHISSVRTQDGAPVTFMLHPADAVLGQRLALTLPAGTTGVEITYATSPDASALQWLTARQTAGGKHPFLFSQCQAIHARSVVPLQDTPRVRITFTAALTVPAKLRALMAATFVDRTVQGDAAVERYEMVNPIPPYLFALAVGELVSRDLGERSRVWAEPPEIESAAWEFAQVDHMLDVAESLFGPYPWGRFDFLVMPPSFPYGGMENPCLTFLTPTLLAGDRSLVHVLAHELAHSWTGNLVTNANAEHFWLNEGFTIFAERRIQEKLEGVEMHALHEALGRRALDAAILSFAQQPGLTRLRTELAGVDPDEAFSVVPYEKGYLFLKTLERHVGRAAFDGFLKRYIDTFRFQSILTDDFLHLLEEVLPGAYAAVDGATWVDGEGVPENAPVAASSRLDALSALGSGVPSVETAAGWSSAEWQLYLDHLNDHSQDAPCAALDAAFHLSDSKSAEILVGWLELCIHAGYAPPLARLDAVLGRIGRMKYLKPLYAALIGRPELRDRARDLFERHGAGYHPIARQVVAGLLGKP